MPRRRKTRHGATQPEETRDRAQLLLRLRPDTIALIRERATEREETISGYVERLVERDVGR